MKIILRESKIIDKLFEIGVWIKAVFGFFEILGGMLFALSGQMIVDNIIIYFAQQEIMEDPNDLLANYLIKFANDFSFNTQIFAVAYLLFHGAVNILLVVFLLKNKIWFFPWAIGLLGGFVIYQVYRYFHTYSPLLLLIIMFDIFFISIVWLEYKKKKRKK